VLSKEKNCRRIYKNFGNAIFKKNVVTPELDLSA
jgi:hypothetical protein